MKFSQRQHNFSKKNDCVILNAACSCCTTSCVNTVVWSVSGISILYKVFIKKLASSQKRTLVGILTFLGCLVLGLLFDTLAGFSLFENNSDQAAVKVWCGLALFSFFILWLISFEKIAKKAKFWLIIFPAIILGFVMLFLMSILSY